MQLRSDRDLQTGDAEDLAVAVETATHCDNKGVITIEGNTGTHGEVNFHLW